MPNITKENGKWMIRWRETDETGVHQRRKRGFNTKKEAEAWYYFHYKEFEDKEKAVAVTTVEPVESDPNSIMFADLAEAWLVYQKNRVKESSYVSNVNRVRNIIIPAFEGKRVADIKPLDILHWMEGLQAKYAFGYAKTLYTRLASIYRYGVKYYDITNVMEKVDRPRNTQPKKQMQVWTPEQFQKVIEQIDDPEYNFFIRTLYLLGCRRGELQALQWQDIDFDARTIHICHTITNKTTAGPWAMTSPKTTGSDRKIKISERQMREFRDLYDARHPSPDHFVFGILRPLPEQTIGVKFRAAAKAAGVPQIRIHDLRHSCASYLISQGVDIVTVSRRLGHSSVKQTLDTYSHMMPSAEDLSVNIMDKIV